MDYNKARKLAEIIVRLRLRKVSDDERAFLNDWLDESEANRQTYKRIIRGEAIARRLRAEVQINATADFAAVTARIARRLTRGRRRPLRVAAWGSAAAVLAGAVYFAFVYEKEPEFVPYPYQPTVIAAVPEVEAKAVLVTASGERVDLEKQVPDTIVSGRAIVCGGEGRLTYVEKDTAPSVEAREEWNKVITSIGGEYFVTLSDGTRVWLNVNTELEFPVSFVRDERVVRLKGEAYFEVARDERKPFIVKTAGMTTRVLGTAFNIKAYADERDERATLLEGSVEVALSSSAQGKTCTVLEPGMQARWRAGSRSLSVQAVNSADVVAWRRGEFVFNEEDISVVLQTLSRWYGVEFIAEAGEMETYTFSGMMSKDDKLETTLEILTLAGGPSFRIEGDKIYMSKNKSRP